MLIDGVHITPVKSVRDLGIYIDADLSMRIHVQKTVSCCFAALRQLRQIRRSVPSSTFQKLVVALVHSRLDYGNGVLVGIPAHLRRLQSVLNAAAWLIFNLKRSDHITDALVSLHWLWVAELFRFPPHPSQIWNSLPETVVSASTLRSFQLQLKTFLFELSFIH